MVSRSTVTWTSCWEARGRYHSRGRRVFVFYNRLLLPGPCDATYARQTANATTTPAKAKDPLTGMPGKLERE